MKKENEGDDCDERHREKQRHRPPLTIASFVVCTILLAERRAATGTYVRRWTAWFPGVIPDMAVE